MKEINTNINLIDSTVVLKTPAIIKLDEIDNDKMSVEITIKYNQIEYIGKGTDYLWVDAFVDLQKKLPKHVKIACCMTCKHGNMCPFGNIPRELYCTKYLNIYDKLDLCEKFNKYNLYENNKTLCDSYCDSYESQNKDYYTYNDYIYLLIKDN